MYVIHSQPEQTLKSFKHAVLTHLTLKHLTRQGQGQGRLRRGFPANLKGDRNYSSTTSRPQRESALGRNVTYCPRIKPSLKSKASLSRLG